MELLSLQQRKTVWIYCMGSALAKFRLQQLQSEVLSLPGLEAGTPASYEHLPQAEITSPPLSTGCWWKKINSDGHNFGQWLSPTNIRHLEALTCSFWQGWLWLQTSLQLLHTYLFCWTLIETDKWSLRLRLWITVITSYKCGKEPYCYNTSHLEKPDYRTGICYQQARLMLKLRVSGWSAEFKYIILVKQINQSLFFLQMLVLKRTQNTGWILYSQKSEWEI